MGRRYNAANGFALRLHKAAKAVIRILRDTTLTKNVREQRAVEFALDNHLYIENTGKGYDVIYEGAPLYFSKHTKEAA